MSASPVFSSAAVGRPFIFPGRGGSHAVVREELASAVTPASRLQVRSAPAMASCGIAALDALTGGLPRGCLTEICGSASSGRTTVLLAALAEATQRGEVCALVDACDALHPASAAAAGIELGRLLWVRCAARLPRLRSSDAPVKRPSARGMSPIAGEAGNALRIAEWRLEQVLKVTDLLLQSHGFGMIVLDLSGIPARSARQIPLASWFRFRRAVEHTPTVLLILEQQPIAGSCSSILLRISGARTQAAGKRVGHAELLDEFEITAELLRSRLERKQPQSITSFTGKAAWAS